MQRWPLSGRWLWDTIVIVRRAASALSLLGLLAGILLAVGAAGEEAPGTATRLTAAAPAAGDDQAREWVLQARRYLGAHWDGPTEPYREFYFTRAFYSSGGNDLYRGFPSWSVDYPKADLQFLAGVKRLVGFLDAYERENPISLADPELARYPFLYAVEVGYMALTEPEVLGLRRYLQQGGFLVVDDFWGSREWANFERELKRVLPDHPIVEVPLDHPIFHCFYEVDEVVQVPNVGQGTMGGPTWERDGYYPKVRGVFDDHGRLMVVINWNSDLGDAWEWAEDPFYPLHFSTYAYQMGVNFIVYAMSH